MKAGVMFLCVFVFLLSRSMVQDLNAVVALSVIVNLLGVILSGILILIEMRFR